MRVVIYNIYQLYRSVDTHGWRLNFKDWVGPNTETARAQDSITTVDDDTWHYAVRCRRSGMLELYVDGVLTATAPANAGPIVNAADLYIGRSGWQRYNGYIDEVQIRGVAPDPAWIRLAHETQRPDQVVVTIR